MSELGGIAEARRLPARVLIGGEWVSAASDAAFDSVDPSTGRVLAAMPAGGHEDVDCAVASARKAFMSGGWSRLHSSERKAVLEGAPLRAAAAGRNGIGQLLQ